MRNLIFDLDGTLLNTIVDINAAINEALRRCGYDYSFSVPDTRYLIGDGADALVRRALKENGGDLRRFQELKAVYMPLYKALQCDHVAPFPGLKETLEEARRSGYSFYVSTNKPHALALDVLTATYGEGFFSGILGAKEGQPVKPDPTGVLSLMEEFGLKKEECVYVGDSHVDVLTARNAGIPVILVGWGYETNYPEWKDKADYFVEDRAALVSLLK